MEMRRSRRLRGLVPEESLLQQIYFICQREIDIGSLTRCQRTSCGGVFMHKSCHRHMVTTLPTCGNCRRNNAEYQRETVLETDEEMEPVEENPFEITLGMAPPARNTLVVMKLIEYRLKRRYIHTHYRRSHFWPEIPYEADPSIWLNYELFTRLFPSNPLYVHGGVMLPTSATSAMRHAVYRMFMYNTPFTVFEITNPFAFRLLFIRNLTTNTLRVDNLWFMPHSGCPPLYPDLFFCCPLSLEDVLHRRERERRRREAIDTIHEYRDQALLLRRTIL